MNIIVTGASRGIGFELVKLFLENQNHRVIAISRNITSLVPLNKESQFRCISMDLTETDGIPGLNSTIASFFDGKVHILINNAGSLINKHFDQLTSEDFDQMFSVNVKGVFMLVKNILPFFHNPSHIVNIGSMGGVQGTQKFPGLSLYAASKGALSVLSECMAAEFKPLGIAVNALAPGAVETQMLTEAFPGYKAPVTASEMAQWIAHFALNGHKFFNGKIIPVSLSTP